MNTITRITLLLAFAAIVTPALSGTISPTIQYDWSETSGWCNLAAPPSGGVSVYTTAAPSTPEQKAGLFVSTDGCGTWTAMNGGLP